jgi:thymidylate kinase
MTITVAFDGPDYSGKSTTVAKVAKILEGLGLRVGVANHPQAVTETGRYARLQLVTGKANDIVARAMCQDFEYTLHNLVPLYDIVLCDRWAPVTIANQGDEGKHEVFRSGICNMPGAPSIYVSMEVGYETAVKRNQKRLEEKGQDWDAAVSGKMFVSPEAWEAACSRYRYAFQILTEGGSKFDLIQLNEKSSEFAALDVASKIAQAYARQLQEKQESALLLA